MGCKVKFQKEERAVNRSFYVNFPVTLAEAINIKKGEEMEWFIEGKNEFILKRVKKVKSFKDKK